MFLPLLMIGAAMGGGQAQNPRRPDQMRAFDARREGRLLPIPEIEARVVPTMKVPNISASISIRTRPFTR